MIKMRLFGLRCLQKSSSKIVVTRSVTDFGNGCKRIASSAMAFAVKA
jgi:hypothetical protein